MDGWGLTYNQLIACTFVCCMTRVGIYGSEALPEMHWHLLEFSKQVMKL